MEEEVDKTDRRYFNEDGTLTELGLIKYKSGVEKCEPIIIQYNGEFDKKIEIVKEKK